MPIIFLGIAIAGFFMFTSPLYQNISKMKAQATSYNEALSNSKALENERDKLTAKYNAISVEDLEKIKKLLPDNIDNIRLILEIEKVASPYSMVLKDVKYDIVGKETPKIAVATPGAVPSAGATPSIGITQQAVQTNYGILNLQFSVSGTYNNFLKFTKDLQNNLRIVDLSAVSFSSEGDAKTSPLGIYKYDFKVKTYWLKN